MLLNGYIIIAAVNLGNMRQYLLLAAAVISIAGLYLVSTASDPASISPASLPEHEGEAVQVTGLVVHVERYNEAASFVLRDGSVSTRVFSPDGVAARLGDRVQVTGEVQRYEGTLEIVSEEVTILERANDTVPLSALAEQHSHFLDTCVTTHGVAVNVTRRSFRLVNGSCSVEVRHPGRPCNVTAGDQVIVTAMLRYDPQAMCFYLSIERNSHHVTRLR